MENSKEKVLALLQDEKIRHLYANTFYSLFDRIDEHGYIEESFVPDRYPGNFTRTSGAFSLLMADCGEIQIAERAVRFVLDAMQRFHVFYSPHVLGKLTCRPNGQWEQHYETVNQIDGTAHVLLAYSNLLLKYQNTGLLDDYWNWISDIMDINLTQPNFCGDDYSKFSSTTLHLFFNPMLEHSREGRYWSCYDILTQSFMGAALEKFITIACARKEDDKARRWQKRLDWLRQGVRDNLTIEINGKTCYAEMRIPDGNRGRIFDGIGWLNLSPLAAEWNPCSWEVTENTVRAVRNCLWLEDPMGDNLHYLDIETQPDRLPHRTTIGKALGWDMEASLLMEDYDHLYEQLLFLKNRHEADIYGEGMAFQNGKWTTWDNGNGEQCVWWCRSMGRVRRALGLPYVPFRQDVTCIQSFQ